MIVTELHIERIAIFETKADTPLIVDRDGVLACTISAKRVEPVARWNAQIGELGCHVHGLELAQRPSRYVGRETFCPARAEEFLR